MSLVVADKVAKIYRVGDVEVPALRGIDFAIEPASFVSFVGPSGSGKTTLLNMVGCLGKPSSGRLTVLDTDVAALDRRAAASFRGASARTSSQAARSSASRWRARSRTWICACAFSRFRARGSTISARS